MLSGYNYSIPVWYYAILEIVSNVISGNNTLIAMIDSTQ